MKNQNSLKHWGQGGQSRKHINYTADALEQLQQAKQDANTKRILTKNPRSNIGDSSPDTLHTKKVTVFIPAGPNMLLTFSFELELDIGAMIFNIISISDWMFNLNQEL